MGHKEFEAFDVSLPYRVRLSDDLASILEAIPELMAVRTTHVDNMSEEEQGWFKTMTNALSGRIRGDLERLKGMIVGEIPLEDGEPEDTNGKEITVTGARDVHIRVDGGDNVINIYEAKGGE